MKPFCQHLLVFTALTMICAGLRAADEKGDFRSRNKEFVAQQLEQRKQELGDKDHIMIAPGLIADKHKREVRIVVENNGLGKKDPAEYMIIGEKSEHDYEAVATALCTPAALNEALMFIGMKPGRATDYKNLHMWPRGDRVILHYEWDDTAEGKTTRRRERAEKFIWHMKEEATIPEEGWVYLGSRMVEQQGSTNLILAADAYGPFALVSCFNSRDNILEVPRLAHQDYVYDHYEMNPEFHMEKGTLMEAVFTPEFTNGQTRVHDYVLTISSQEKKDDDAPLEHIVCAWQEKGSDNTQSFGLKSLFDQLKKLKDEKIDAHTTLILDDALTASEIRAIYFIINQTASQNLIRLEPPAEGHLFYRAWLPPEEWRSRVNRISQPLELTLTKNEDGVSGTLAVIQAEYKDQKVEPELTVTDLPAPDPDALKALLAQSEVNLPVLLIFAPADLTRRELHDFVDVAIPSHPTIHIYVNN
jgi:hypothetical protein